MLRTSSSAACAVLALATGVFSQISPQSAHAEEPAAVQQQPALPAVTAPPTKELPANDTGTQARPAEQSVTAIDPSAPIPDPILAKVREKLAEPPLAKSADSGDLAALAAFYGERSGPPLWVTETGFTPKANSIVEAVQKADEWGLSAAAFDVPLLAERETTPEVLADAEIKLGLAVLKYARYARGGASILPG